MTDKLGEGDPPRSPPVREAGAGAALGGLQAADMPVERAQRLGVSCAWCGFRMVAGAPRMQLFQRDSVKDGGKSVAHFHKDCGQAILRLCAERSLAEACTEIAVPRAPSGIVCDMAGEDDERPKAKPDPVALRREARELAARGFTAQMISARLRAPYALVAAALASTREPTRKAVRP